MFSKLKDMVSRNAHAQYNLIEVEADWEVGSISGFLLGNDEEGYGGRLIFVGRASKHTTDALRDPSEGMFFNKPTVENVIANCQKYGSVKHTPSKHMNVQRTVKKRV